MLQLYDLDKVKIRGLKSYKDLNIESNLSTADKSLSFLYPSRLSKEIVEEGYIRTKTDEFVIKSIETKKDYKAITAVLNIEDLEGRVFEHFDTSNESIMGCLNLALAGTGWTIGTCDVTRRRTVRKTNSSSWEIIQEAKKNYRAELEFDTLSKKINIFEKRGSDKGTYFIDSLNLKSLDIESTSYDFYTRIIGIGKDDLRVTLENFQYSQKVKTFIWKDERYTQIDSLREDAAAKLNELSKPRRAYSASIVDLASMNEKYKDILNYRLGDTITLISKDEEIKEKQRIIKIVEYPHEPEKNVCEIANATLKFEDMQKEQQDTSSTVANITTDNGTIDGSTIDSIKPTQIDNFEASIIKVTNLTVVNARIDNLYAKKADIDSLNAVIINVGNLYATKANITDLTAINATIDNLIATTAKIGDLTAINAKITVLEVNAETVNTLLAGNIGASNIQAGAIQAGSGIIANLAIGDAQINAVNAGKLVAGTVDTSKVTIQGANGRLKITGNRLQVFANKADNSLYERVSIGDVNGDGTIYGLRVRGADGVTILLDETGVKREGITDGSINNKKIGEDANISGTKLDIASVVTSVNNGTTKIQGSKVFLNNSTLDVQFSTLNTTVGSQGTTIASHTGSISANATAIGLKVASQTYNTKMATLDGNISNIGDTLNTQNSSIDVLKGQILLKVTQTDIDTAVEPIRTSAITANNLAKNAQTKADTAFTNAGVADTKALNANTLAGTANTNAGLAQGTANTAKTNAGLAQTQADTATANASTAQEKANSAFTNASNAQTQADKGITNSATANALLTDLASDNKLTAVEKQTTKKEWDGIVSEKVINDTQANTFGVVTEKNTYDSAYNTLSTYITPLVATLTNTSDIVGTTFRSNFKSYYDAKTVLLNVIAAKAKTLAESAQGQANTATTNASNAQGTADTAKADALTAQNKANSATTDAGNAQAKANSASTDALTANTNAGKAQIKADQAQLDATKANTALTALATRVSTSETSIVQLNTGINMKASKVDLETTSIIAKGAVTDASSAQATANKAVTDSGTAIANASTAQSKANTAYTNAGNAQAKADTGVANALTAKNLADKGISDALSAHNLADKGVTDASSAKARADLGVTNAGLAQTKANQGVTDASTAKARADQAVTDAQKAQNSADNIQIGGMNLFVNSPMLGGIGNFNKLSGYDGIKRIIDDATAKSGKVVEFECTKAGTGFYISVFDVIERTIYTWSLMVKCNVNKSGSIGHEKGGQTSVSFTQEWKKLTYTFTGNSNSYHQFTFYTGWNIGEILSIKDFKFEEGNKATDYTFAKEDIQNQLDQALLDALTAQTQANKGVTDASNAQSKANTASTEAGTAQTQANKGVTDASNAQSKANTAYTNAGNAQSTANTGVANASTAQTQANKGVADALTAQQKADKAVADALLLTTRVKTAETTLDLIPGQFALVATKTDLTTTNNNVTGITTRIKTAESSITAQAGQIDLKATKIDLNTTNNNLGNVTNRISAAEASIKVNAGEINLKASQTSLNTTNNNLGSVTNRMSSAEGSIRVQADQIAQKVAINNLGTLIKQNGDSVRTSIGEIGGANLLIDSNFELGITGCEGISNGTEARVCIPPSYCNPILRGNKSLYIRHPNGDAYTNTNLRAYMRPDTVHTISYWYKCAGAITGGSSFGYINDGPYSFSINPASTIADSQWHRVTIVYRSSVDPNVTHIQLRFGYHSVGDSWMIINCVQVEEGAIASAWTPNVNELKNSSFELTDNHARFTGQDGSYTEFCPNYTGLKWHKGSTSKDYHYLLYRGSVSNVETQNGVRIYFPAEFRGKDYQVGWWAGNVFPKNAEDLLYSANVEFIDENRNEAWIGLRASIMVRNPATESAPFWRGKMNIMYMIIA